MNQFLVAFNAVMPIFLMITLGYVAKKIGIFKEDFGNQASRFVFKISLPAMIFSKVASIDLKSSISVSQLKLLVFSVCAILVSYLLSKLIFLLIVKENKKDGVNTIGTCIQGGFRCNYLIIGYPILFNIFGDDIIASIAVLTLGVIPAFNILSIVALTSNKHVKGLNNYKNIIINILKNPLIIAIILGFISAALGINFEKDYPIILSSFIDMIANLATPLGLIAIGAFFHFDGFKRSMSLSMIVVSIKLILLPLVISFAAYCLGFDVMNVILITVIFGGPTAVSSFAMSNELGGDPVLAGNIVIMSSALCVFTLIPIIAFWMSVMG